MPLADAGKDEQPQGEHPKSVSRETCQRDALVTGRGVPESEAAPSNGPFPQSGPAFPMGWDQ